MAFKKYVMPIKRLVRMNRNIITKGQTEPIKEPIETVLIEILRKNPNSTYDNLAKQMDISRSTVKRTIKTLVENQQIEHIGGRRYGYWKINV